MKNKFVGPESMSPGENTSRANRPARLALKTGHRFFVKAGRLLGLLTYVLDNRHRRIVRRNLKFTHPRWSKKEIETLSRRLFQNTGTTFLEICQIPFLSREDILKKVRIKGQENLIQAFESPKGAIMISAHLGNWEMAPLFASCYFQRPVVAVARRLRSELLERWISNARTRFGNMIIDKERALPKMIRALRKGMVLGILIDQGTTPSEGVEVTFFGRTTTATPAAALLARRYDIPVYPAFCVRDPDGGLTVLVERRLCIKKTSDPKADLSINTQIMTNAVEKAVRAYPDQWFWFHKRWKHHYPYLYKEDLGRRMIRRMKRKARRKAT